jgi:hypothetical protein
MDTASLLGFLKESLFLIVLFFGFLGAAIGFGRQTITNIILGLYLAFLISLQFPYYPFLLSKIEGETAQSLVILVIFLIFAAVSTWLFIHIMPREFDEGAFEDFWKKLLLAGAATVLVAAFSYHALPVTELVSPGSPVQYLFGSEKSFFWWLLAPIVILFIV